MTPRDHVLRLCRVYRITPADLDAEWVDYDGSHVYFAQARDGSVKIGVTRFLGQRMSQITPRVELLAAVPGDRHVERRMHTRFAHLRIRGEWFAPVPELMEYIATLEEAVA